jgi:hypothetical protein
MPSKAATFKASGPSQAHSILQFMLSASLEDANEHRRNGNVTLSDQRSGADRL